MAWISLGDRDKFVEDVLDRSMIASHSFDELRDLDEPEGQDLVYEIESGQIAIPFFKRRF